MAEKKEGVPNKLKGLAHGVSVLDEVNEALGNINDLTERDVERPGKKKEKKKKKKESAAHINWLEDLLSTLDDGVAVKEREHVEILRPGQEEEEEQGE